jgi:hypothetical protein
MSASKIREFNINVWKHTNRIADKYKFKPAKKLQYKAIKSATQDNINADTARIIRVYHENMVNTLVAIADVGLSPLIIINANNNWPVENLRHGVISAECDIFRASNIKETLNDTMYPIKADELIHCEQIAVFKTSDGKVIKEIMAAAALISPVKCPTLITINGSEQYQSEADRASMINKIDAMFNLAEANNFDTIMLPAFGCVIEKNPPTEVAELFNSRIEASSVNNVFFYAKSESLFEHPRPEKDSVFQAFHSVIKR